MKTYPTSWIIIAILAFVALFIIILASQPVRAAVLWYVVPDGSDGNDCIGSTTACATINGALNKPGFIAGETILVATGVYTSTGTEVVLLNKNVTLSGGWDVGFTVKSGTSTIEGQGVRRGITVNMDVMTTIERFVVQDSTSGAGGGIFTSGILTLNNSTISNNTAYGGYGGGIFISWGTLTLNSCTVSNNMAVYGGGVANWGTLTLLQNTIVAGNTAGSNPDCSGVIDSAGYNLIGNTTDCTFTPGSGDLTNVNAGLGPLIGAPGQSKYHPLLPDSPAIDAGNPTGCMGSTGLLTTDQRGAARVGRCDIGAYEYTTPGPANTVYAFAGTPQHAPPLGVFGAPLQTVVLDSIGSPVNNSKVTFFAPASGASGTFSNTGTLTTTTVTNESGIATAATFTANGVAGSYAVTATVGGVVTPTIFLLSNVGWYVSPSGNDANDCQTPTTPCATITGALNKPGLFAGDTIRVATGVYTSTSNQVLLLDKNATLSGGWDGGFTTQSSTSTIDGQGTRRGITVNSGIIAIVEHFAVQNGYVGDYSDGGGIHNSGTLTLNNSTVSGNTAGGEGGEGGDGGGIRNSGTLTLNNSAVSSNSSTANTGGGGGIYNVVGTLTLNNSTVSGNTANGYGVGGGIYNDSGTASLINSTISGNIANGAYGGGIYNGQSSTLTLNNSTVSGNTTDGSGGGINNESGTVTLQNSILGENTAGSGPDCWGAIGSAGYNLIGNTSDCTFSPTTGDLTNVDSMLGPLQDNGGSTLTHALLPGSLAIDAGNPAGCMGSTGLLTTDQRGAARVGLCDIGAYEYGGTITVLSSSPNPSIMGETVIFTATVIEGESITPTGSIDFFDDEILLGAGTLNSSGEATFSTSTLPVGTHVITATYTGDGFFGASTGTLSPSQQVNKISTSTTLVSLPNPSVFGHAVTFTATVTSTVGTPTGSVDFYDDEILLGAGTLNSSGEATFSTSTLLVGTHVITATYTGDGNYAVSTGRLMPDQVVIIFKVYLPLVIR